MLTVSLFFPLTACQKQISYKNISNQIAFDTETKTDTEGGYCDNGEFYPYTEEGATSAMKDAEACYNQAKQTRENDSKKSGNLKEAMNIFNNHPLTPVETLYTDGKKFLDSDDFENAVKKFVEAVDHFNNHNTK